MGRRGAHCLSGTHERAEERRCGGCTAADGLSAGVGVCVVSGWLVGGFWGFRFVVCICLCLLVLVSNWDSSQAYSAWLASVYLRTKTHYLIAASCLRPVSFLLLLVACSQGFKAPSTSTAQTNTQQQQQLATGQPTSAAAAAGTTFGPSSTLNAAASSGAAAVLANTAAGGVSGGSGLSAAARYPWRRTLTAIDEAVTVMAMPNTRVPLQVRSV